MTILVKLWANTVYADTLRDHGHSRLRLPPGTGRLGAAIGIRPVLNEWSVRSNRRAPLQLAGVGQTPPTQERHTPVSDGTR